MWHACKQRAFAVVGLQKFSSNRTPFGVSKKEPRSAKARYQGHAKYLACSSSGEGAEQNRRKTCDENSKNRQYLHYCPWLETLGWAGTAFAVGLNLKLCSKTRNSTGKNEVKKLSCFCKATDLLLRLALSMPKTLPSTSTSVLSFETQLNSVPPDNKRTGFENSSSGDSFSSSFTEVEESSRALEDVTCKYFAELENLAGLELLAVDKVKAFGHFLRSSDLGSTKGHFNVGVCYETGQGAAVDFQKAADYYLKASDAGHLFATYNLGLYYMEGRDLVAEQPDKGLKYMLKASELGMADAHYYLGLCYKAGWKVEQNHKTAMDFFSKAALMGHQGAADEMIKLSKELLEEDNAVLRNEEVKFSIEPYVENPVTCNDFSAERELGFYFGKESSTTFRISSSTPDLKLTGNWTDDLGRQTLKSYELAISRYLDVILPYHWIPEVAEDIDLKSVEIIPQVPVTNNTVMKVCLGV